MNINIVPVLLKVDGVGLIPRKIRDGEGPFTIKYNV